MAVALRDMRGLGWIKTGSRKASSSASHHTPVTSCSPLTLLSTVPLKLHLKKPLTLPRKTTLAEESLNLILLDLYAVHLKRVQLCNTPPVVLKNQGHFHLIVIYSLYWIMPQLRYMNNLPSSKVSKISLFWLQPPLFKNLLAKKHSSKIQTCAKLKKQNVETDAENEYISEAANKLPSASRKNDNNMEREAPRQQLSSKIGHGHHSPSLLFSENATIDEHYVFRN